jgi:DNA mismatch repair ATPase MutS
MADITTQATQDSLVVIDEPCVSTSVRDGVGLSIACLERLIARRSFVVCATHHCELEALSSLYGSVSVKEMRVRQAGEEGRIEYLYQIGEGSISEPGYGIAIASQFLPPDFIRDAHLAHRTLTEPSSDADREGKGRSKSRNKPTRRTGEQAKAAIIQRLLALHSSSLDNHSLMQSILALRSHCKSQA